MITSWRDSQNFIGRAGLLCMIGAVSLFASSCVFNASDGDGGGDDCPDGQREFQVGGETACHPTCESDSDCDSLNGAECQIPDGSEVGACVGGDNGGGGGPDAGDMTDADDDNGNGDEDTGTEDDGGGGSGECTPENSGTRTCAGISDCFSENNCSQYEQGSTQWNDCRNNCINQGTCDAQDRWDGLMTCAEDECSSQDSSATCTLDNCSNEYESCGLTGNLSCAERTHCDLGCQIMASQNNDGQQAVIDAYRQCVTEDCEAATLEGQTQSTERLECQDENCSGDDVETACMWNQCEEEQNNCGLTGDKTCKEIRVAQGGCLPGQGEEWTADAGECYMEATYTGTQEAQIQNSEYTACLNDECGDESGISGLISCPLDNCTDETNTCGLIGDTHQACSETMNCALVEGNGFRNCLYNSTEQAQRDFETGYNCALDNDCFDASSVGEVDECMQNNCSSEWETCDFTEDSGGG